MAIAAGRSIAAIPVLLVCARGQRFTFSPAQIGGAIAYAATVALFVFATRMTTAAMAIFLQYTAPIYVAIIGPDILMNGPCRSTGGSSRWHWVESLSSFWIG